MIHLWHIIIGKENEAKIELKETYLEKSKMTINTIKEPTDFVL